MWAQGTLGAQKTGGGRKDPVLEPLEGPQHWDTLTTDGWSPPERGQASGVQSLRVWSFVTAAPGSSCSWWEAPCPVLKPTSH